MAKQFLDYEGLDYYDSLIKQFINNGLNDTLQSALEHFSGALIPRGVIKNIKGATYIDLRSEALEFYKAKTGDVYFIGENGLNLTYVDTTGTVVQDDDVNKGDAIVCIVSADIATNGSVVSDAQWATLQSNWTVTPNNSARLEFGQSQTTIKLAEVGGETIQLQVAPSSTIASSLRDDLADLGVVAVPKNTARPGKNIATSITSSSAGNLVPTDKAVYDFVSKHMPNAVTKLDWAREDDGSISEPLSLDITGGTDEGWLPVPVADGSKSGVMTPKLHQELKESVNTVTPLIDDKGSLTIENAFNNGDTFSFPVPLASKYNDGAMSKEDKETLDEVAKEIDDKADYKGMYVSTDATGAALKICTLTVNGPWQDLSVQFRMTGRSSRVVDVFVQVATNGSSEFIKPYSKVITRSVASARTFPIKACIKNTEHGFTCEVWASLVENEYLYVAKKTIGGNDTLVNNEDFVDWGMNLYPEMPSEEGYDDILNPETPEWHGNADTASKLGTTTVGSTKQPIYLNGGTATPIDSLGGLVKDVNVRHDASGDVLVETEDYDGDFSSVSIPVATDVAGGVMSADMFKRLDFGTGARTYVLPYFQVANELYRSQPILIKLGSAAINLSYLIEVAVNGYQTNNPGKLFISFYNYLADGRIVAPKAISTFGIAENVKIFNRSDGYTYCLIPALGYFIGYSVTVSTDEPLTAKPTIAYEDLPAEDEIVLSANIPVTNIAYEPEERNKVSGLISGSVSAGNASLLEGIGASGFTRALRGEVGNLGEDTVRYVKIARLTSGSSDTSNLALVKINGAFGTPGFDSSFDLCLSNRGGKKIAGYCKKSPSWDYGDIGINDAGEICIIFKLSWCRYVLSISVYNLAVIEHDAQFTPTDTNFTLLSESNNVIFSNRNTNAVMEAEKATNDGNGVNIATTYLTKAQVNTAASSSLGVKVAFSGTMGNLSPTVTVTTGGVTSTSNSVVSGLEVHTALSGDAYISRIANDDIDNLFA